MDAIIIGSNHSNTLGLIRSLGICGVKPYLLLVNEHGELNYCVKSKYLCGYTVVPNYSDALDYLLHNTINSDNKPVLYPSSDGAEYLLDQNLRCLQRNYIVPNINNEEGAISFLMNKAKQSEWASKMGIKTAPTYLVDTHNCIYGGGYPCIVKPHLSHEGEKADIRKCESFNELENYLEVLTRKGYKDVLVQEFVDYDYQYVIHGALLQNSSLNPFILLKNIREWPNTGGTGCFRCFENNSIIKDYVIELLNKLRESGYRGLFDIELFSSRGKIMLNEINFRSSGVGYSMLKTKVYYPYFFYLDAKGESIEGHYMCYTGQGYVMNELSDISNVKHGALSLIKWLRDVGKTKTFAYFFIKDLKPTAIIYWNWMKCRF